MSEDRFHKRFHTDSNYWSNPIGIDQLKTSNLSESSPSSVESFDLEAFDDKFITKRKYRLSEAPTFHLTDQSDESSEQAALPMAVIKFPHNLRSEKDQPLIEPDNRKSNGSGYWSNPFLIYESQIKVRLEKNQETEKYLLANKDGKLLIPKSYLDSSTDLISDEKVETSRSRRNRKRAPTKSRKSGPLNRRLARPNRQLDRYIHRMFHLVVNDRLNTGRRKGFKRVMISKRSIETLNYLSKDVIKKFAESADQLMLYTGRKRMNDWVVMSVVKMLFSMVQFEKIPEILQQYIYRIDSEQDSSRRSF